MNRTAKQSGSQKEARGSQKMTRPPLFSSNLFSYTFLPFQMTGHMIAKKVWIRNSRQTKRRPEVSCTVVVSQRPGCLRYFPKIFCDNIDYSQSQWRCSLFHTYRAHQFSAVSRVTSRKFSSKQITLDRKYVAPLSYPKGPDVCVIYQRYGDIVWQH